MAAYSAAASACQGRPLGAYDGQATDVLALDANPLAGVGPISQEISLPARVVNVVELYPRIISLLPLGALRTAMLPLTTLHHLYPDSATTPYLATAGALLPQARCARRRACA